MEEAETEYLKAIALDPSDADAHNNFGALLANTQRLKRAEKEFRKALALDPKDADAQDNLLRLGSDRIEPES